MRDLNIITCGRSSACSTAMTIRDFSVPDTKVRREDAIRSFRGLGIIGVHRVEIGDGIDEADERKVGISRAGLVKQINKPRFLSNGAANPSRINQSLPLIDENPAFIQ